MQPIDEPAPDGLIFYLAPFGRIPDWIMSYVGRVIIENFGAGIARMQSRELPSPAHLPNKEAYDADYLLEDLKFWAEIKNLSIVGITTATIYTVEAKEPILLDGYAYLGGPAVLISIPPAGDNPDEKIKLIIKNILLHELGHFFGLKDQGLKNCLMNSRKKTTTPDLEFCSACKKRIQKKIAEKWPK